MIDFAQLQTSDISTMAGIREVRRTFLQEAIDAQNREAIDLILTTILRAQPDRLPEHAERINNALDMEDMERAEQYYAEFNSSASDMLTDARPLHSLLIVRSAYRLGKLNDAVDFCDILRFDFETPKLGFILLQVYNAAKRPDRILEIADRVYAMSSDTPNIRARLIQYLVDSGYTRKAIQLAGPFDDGEVVDIEVALHRARANLRMAPTDPASLKMIERVAARAPNREDIQLHLSKAYLQYGQAKEALNVLNIDPAGPVTGKESYRQHVAETLVANDYYREAGLLYREMSREKPLHEGWRRAGIGALLQAGEEKMATALYEEDRIRRRLSAHDTFKERLASIDSNLDQAPIPQVRFDWAYNKLTQLGAAPIDRKTWEDASRRVYLADELTINWLETRTSDADQLLSLMQNPVESFAPLTECLASGQGAFIAGLHIGSMFAAPAMMAALGIDFKWLASTPAVSTMPGAERLLSTSSMNTTTIARAVLRAIKKSEAVVIAIDGGAPSVSRPVSFHGDDILVTDFVPRMVYQTKARSFFPRVAWIEDEIVFDLIELIPPDPSETMEAFVAVWFQDYMSCLEDFFVAAPDNMRLAGGFWTQLAY